MSTSDGQGENNSVGDPILVDLTLQIPTDLHRAFQRCVWIQINETGCDQLDVMQEVIKDFLIKRGC